jgi:uncharacterized protein (UPF0305 family)
LNINTQGLTPMAQMSVAFRVWLREKPLHPVAEGNQTLLLLTP